ncbi:Nuclear transport factor 2 [Linnemannia exigua]|uniref:Nuclear transport factor 2 n=1 Tax=Linnemannia exigua TaxID=604196 RepID=A0AAD4H250_9FUNG|nr:Nuclear transport factor 2 [Linnemannia exigua]
MDLQAVADQFVTYYYQTFDGNRGSLGPLYRPTSMLSFEGNQTLGDAAIVEKLAALPLDGLRHQVSTKDAQPAENNSILILVSGQLLAGGETNPQFFTQSFLLKPDGGSYYIQNDVFRLVYGL